MNRQRMTMFGLFGAMAILLTACVDGGAAYAEESFTRTGLYGPGFHYYDDGYGGWGWDGNFDPVYVGIPFEHSAGAVCYDSSGAESDWYGDVSIFSGELPPGLELVDQYTIAGVPTRAGTWHLRVAFNNLVCAGTYYETRYQDLTFKTSGN